MHFNVRAGGSIPGPCPFRTECKDVRKVAYGFNTG